MEWLLTSPKAPQLGSGAGLEAMCRTQSNHSTVGYWVPEAGDAVPRGRSCHTVVSAPLLTQQVSLLHCGLWHAPVRVC